MREMPGLHAHMQVLPQGDGRASSRQSVAPPTTTTTTTTPLWRAFVSPTGPSAGTSATNGVAIWDTGTLVGQLARLTGNRRVGARRHCNQGKCPQVSDIVTTLHPRARLERQKRRCSGRSLTFSSSAFGALSKLVRRRKTLQTFCLDSLSEVRCRPHTAS